MPVNYIVWAVIIVLDGGVQYAVMTSGRKNFGSQACKAKHK